MLLKWLARLAGFREGLTRRYYRVASFSRCEEGAREIRGLDERVTKRALDASMRRVLLVGWSSRRCALFTDVPRAAWR
jgi:hypothetical protein